jgi:hypothetical protein
MRGVGRGMKGSKELGGVGRGGGDGVVLALAES